MGLVSGSLELSAICSICCSAVSEPQRPVKGSRNPRACPSRTDAGVPSCLGLPGAAWG